MQDRPLCPICNEHPVAVNYVKDEVYHYRSSCSACIRKGRKLKAQPPAWVKSGYQKKERCERCNFKAKTLKQLFVYHVDGSLKNVDWNNLKTICANCQIEIQGSNLPWKAAATGIRPDF